MLNWLHARRRARLLENGTESRGRITGIRVRSTVEGATQYDLAVVVMPSAGQRFRVGIRQRLDPGDRLRLGKEVLVRHDDRRRVAIVADGRELGWKPLRRPPPDGVDDSTPAPATGERVRTPFGSVALGDDSRARLDALPEVPTFSPADAVAAAPIEDAEAGVSFDTWVAIEAGIVRERISPDDCDEYAQKHGVEPGRWPVAQAAWHARMTADWTIGARFGEAYEAALKSGRRVDGGG